MAVTNLQYTLTATQNPDGGASIRIVVDDPEGSIFSEQQYDDIVDAVRNIMANTDGIDFVTGNKSVVSQETSVL